MFRTRLFPSLCLIVMLSLMLNPLSVFADTLSFATHADWSTGSSSAPTAVAVADFDQDGKLDLAVTNGGKDNVRTLLGDGAGGFTNGITVTVGATPSDIATVDLNKDGHLDLAVTNQDDNNVSILLGDGAGGFTYGVTKTVGTGPTAMAVGDFNKDGNPDLIVTNGGVNNSLSVLRGNGSGGFTISAITLSAGQNAFQFHDVAVADFDRDGIRDFVVVDDYNAFIVMGKGDGTFYTSSMDSKVPQILSTSGNSMSVAVADLNSDGLLDVVLGNNGSNTPVEVFLSQSGLPAFTRTIYNAGGYEPISVAIIDLDGDGALDLAISNRANAKASVLLGAGDGTFGAATSFTVGNAPRAITATDLNRDGKPDLITVNNYSNSVSVLLNTTAWKPTGSSFSGPIIYDTDYAFAFALTQGDFNRDGKLDLAVGHNSGSRFQTYQGTGTGGFTRSADLGTTNGVMSLAAGDYDRDGDLDVALARSNSQVQIMTNDGSGGFSAGATYATAGAPLGIAAGDLNGDGALDVVLANNANDAGNSISVFLNKGTGVYSDTVNYTVGTGPSYVALADLNGDGTLDVAVTNYVSNTVSILRNDGAGVLTLTTDIAVNQPEGIVAGDFDRDGDQDLAVGGNSQITILLNNGAGEPPEVKTKYVPFQIRPLIAADLNRDGILDLVAGRYQSGANPVAVVLGVGDGTFGTATIYTGTSGNQRTPAIIAGDYNQDGALDLAFVQPNSVSPYSQQLSIRLNQMLTAPSFGSANATSFTTDIVGSFTITTTGIPTVTLISQADGALPSGVSLMNHGDGTATFSGAPGSSAGGLYALTFRAANGVLPDATQAFTLTVNQPPAITSAEAVTFTVGAAGDMMTTATGYPTPTITLSEGGLPQGVSFSSETGILSGAPAPGTRGVYPVTFRASNGIGSAATQPFTLTVLGPQLAIVKDVTPASAAAGATITYTLALSNTGDASATRVCLTETLPAELTSATYVVSGVNITPTGSIPYVWQVADLTVGTRGEITVTGVLSAGPPAGHIFTNTATLAAHEDSASSSATVTVLKSETSTTLTSAPDPSSFGQTVTFTATLSSLTATGTVTFSEGATDLGTGTLANGVARWVTDTLSVGTHTITASYGGDANHHGGVSQGHNQVVVRADTTMVLDSGTNPAQFLQTVYFTATVSSLRASGAVTFTEGVTTFGTGALVEGVATFSTSSLSVGAHSVVATYGGDSSYTGSTSSAHSQTITRASTTTTLTSDPNPSQFGQTVCFTATVSPWMASGTVTFTEGTTTLGTATLNASGVATFTTPSLTGGEHTLRAQYSGDADYAPSTSDARTQTVTRAGTRTTLALAPNPSVYGQRVTYTATVITVVSASLAQPTGPVTYTLDDSTPLTGTLNLHGQATASTTALATGSYTPTVRYGGDGNYMPSTSPDEAEIVNRASTSTALVSSPMPSIMGRPATFTVTVTAVTPGAGTPTGAVTVSVDSAPFFTGTLNAYGVAAFTTTQLAPGPHTLAARYAGDLSFQPSVAAVSHRVVAVDLVLTKRVLPEALLIPGNRLTCTLTLSNTGSGGATGIVMTDVIPAEITDLAYSASGIALTRSGSTNYVWRVSDLGAGAGGVVTITGRLRTGLHAGYVLTNTASVSCAQEEIDLRNDAASVHGVVGRVAPVAVNDAYNAMQNGVLRVSAPGIQANDSDVNGDTLTAIRVSGPIWGILSLQANGAFVYTPTAHYFGTDAFSYKLNDGALDSSVATVTLTVASNWPTPLPYNAATRWLTAYGSGPLAGGWTNQDTYPRLVGDVNGDGKADVVGIGHAVVLVSLSTGTGLRPSQTWSTQLTPAEGWISQDTYPRFLADVNGDGKADLIGCGTTGVWVALSTGTRFSRMVPWSTSFGASPVADGWMSQNLYPRAMGDLNGDGKADMVGFGGGGVWVALSDGARFGRATLWASAMGSSPSAGSWTSQNQFPRMVGDLNGDGKSDVVGLGTEGVYVLLSTGYGLTPQRKWSSSFGSGPAAGGWNTQDAYPRMLADVNGDGKLDIVGFGVEGAYYALSTGGSFGSMVYGLQAFGAFAPSSGGWATQNQYPRFAGDLNGDHKADLLGCQATGMYVTLQR